MIKSTVETFEERAMKAHEYLGETHESHALLKAKLERLREMRKCEKGALMTDFIARGNTQGKAEHMAYADDNYINHLGIIEEAEAEFIELDNRRKNAIKTIDMFITLSANSRKGSI